LVAAQRPVIDALAQQRLRPKPAQVVGRPGHNQHEGLAGPQALLKLLPRLGAAEVAGRLVSHRQQAEAVRGRGCGARQQAQPVAARVAPDEPGAGIRVDDMLDQRSKP
jgi:hypothetical protein